MPFEVTTMVGRRREFVLAATRNGANVRRLCRVFGMSAQHVVALNSVESPKSPCLLSIFLSSTRITAIVEP